MVTTLAGGCPAPLAKTFRSRSARKIYWALVAGVPKPRQGRISTFLAKEEREDESFMRIAKHGEEGALLGAADFDQATVRGHLEGPEQAEIQTDLAARVHRELPPPGSCRILAAEVAKRGTQRPRKRDAKKAHTVGPMLSVDEANEEPTIP